MRRLQSLHEGAAYTPSGDAARHVAALIGAGARTSWIAAAAGVSVPTVRKLEDGTPAGNLRTKTAEAILAVTTSAAFSAAPEASRMPAFGARRRLQALQWAGWRHQDFAANGVTKSGVILLEATEHVAVASHRAVCAMFADLWDKRGPSPITRSRAIARGWVSALAWDDIDDPNATPDIGERVSGLDLAEVDWMLQHDTIETVAESLGVREASLVATVRRRGTPEQRRRVLLAAEDMRERRIGLAS